ncbi:MAG: S1 family peptidase [Actinophytocola sp.]|nr:S1 family peptidase [Actinophytocola sp.]
MNRQRALRLAFAAVVVTGVTAAVLPSVSTAEPDSTVQDAISRDLGLTASQAEARFAQQNDAAATESALRAELGEAFGGAYFDSDTGKLVVGVTDDSAASAVEAAGATASPVRFSLSELDAVKAQLDDRTAAAGVTGWYVDVMSNSVVVEVNQAEADAKTAGFLDAAEALSPAVQVAEVDQSPSALSHVRGGDKWSTTLFVCSVGFSATGGNGSKHFVTAGHCTQGAGPAYGHNGDAMGSLGGSTFGMSGDHGKVDVTSGGWTLQGTVNRYGGDDVAVRGSTEQPIGASVCRSGTTTGWHCGTITAKNQTVIYINGGVVGGLTKTTACAEPGDSGGSFISGGQAQGMTSGGSGDCGEGGETYFSPVKPALQEYGLSLVTG